MAAAQTSFITLLLTRYLNTVSKGGAPVLRERRCELACIFSGVCMYQQEPQSRLCVHLSLANAE